MARHPSRRSGRHVGLMLFHLFKIVMEEMKPRITRVKLRLYLPMYLMWGESLRLLIRITRNQHLPDLAKILVAACPHVTSEASA